VVDVAVLTVRVGVTIVVVWPTLIELVREADVLDDPLLVTSKMTTTTTATPIAIPAAIAQP
jgi:hypothetical protein